MVQMPMRSQVDRERTTPPLFRLPLRTSSAYPGPAPLTERKRHKSAKTPSISKTLPLNFLLADVGSLEDDFRPCTTTLLKAVGEILKLGFRGTGIANCHHRLTLMMVALVSGG